MVGIAHAAPVTDCSFQGVGVSCVTSSGTTGTCQPSYDVLGNMSMTCQVSSAAPATSQPQPSSSGVQSPGGTPDSSSVQSPGGTPGSQNNSAVTLINPLKGVNCSGGNGDCLSAFLLNILQFVIYIGGIVVVLMLVFVGFKFVEAQGNSTKLEEARKMLLWTVIGALVLLGSQAIAMGIQATVTALTGG
ncbi:MAG: pilin [Minisyncoccota bacterium]